MSQPGLNAAGGVSIAIVGAGFTGSLLAVHLLATVPPGSTIKLFDGAGRFGRGLAYSTANAGHVLNVRTSNMSAFPDEPADFLRWLSRREGASQPAEIDDLRHRFVPRGLFGDYVAELLGHTAAQAAGRARLLTYDTNVISVAEVPLGVALATGDGESHTVDAAVLCVGNFPPVLPAGAVPEIADGPAYLGDPWDLERLAGIGRTESVMVLGTGLTMVDLVLTLDSQGHRGPILAVSRRGKLPHAHAPATPHADFLGGAPLPATAQALLRRIRGEARRAAAAGQDWRGVIDAIRPHTQALWRGLPLAERRRFLRHVRPYWEIHRHRMAPSVADRIVALRATGRLRIARGRLRGVEPDGSGVAVTLAFHGEAAPRQVRADRLINCAGPETDFARIRDPLVRSLLSTGVARPDPLRLGLDVDEDLSLVDHHGRSSRRLYALGPPTKGALWEITAVPDIRGQCRGFAQRLLQELATARAPALTDS
ncbi:MAG: FAD/NAD(P)-binding protein [Dongiaceae bacterium]